MVHQSTVLKYVRYLTSRAAIRTTNDDSIQQPSTIVQQTCSISSVEVNSWSASKIRILSDLDSFSTITSTKSKKMNTLRASSNEDAC